MPRITVVLPVYNHKRYVERTIQSLLAQDYSDFEIAAVDDGSTDASREVLSRYSSRIRMIEIPHSGPAAARNRAIAHTDSDFIAFMDADDLCSRERLRLSVEKLQSENIDLVASALSFIDASGRPLPGLWTCPHNAATHYWASLLERNWIGTPSVMVRRRVLHRAGVFDETFTHAEDYDLWLRIAQSHDLGFIAQPLIQCRRHAQNTSIDIDRHQRFERMALQKMDRLEAWLAFNCLYGSGQERAEAWIWFLLRSGDPSFMDECSFVMHQYPDSPALQFALGVFQHESGLNTEALATFEALKDNDTASLHNAGVLLALCGEIEAGRSHLEAALRQKPDYHDARRNLAAIGNGSSLRLTRRPFREQLIPMLT